MLELKIALKKLILDVITYINKVECYFSKGYPRDINELIRKPNLQ